MASPGPVPHDLARGPVTRSRLLAAGFSDGQLRSRAYRSPYRGIHVASHLPRTTGQRIAEAALLLPRGGAVGGWAAANLLGATSFDGVSRTGREVDVLLCVPRSSRLRPRVGVRFLRGDLAEQEVEEIDGFTVTGPARTAVDLTRLHPDPRERVVALDALWAEGVVSPDAVATHLQERRFRGAVAVREALPLARWGVLSRQETRFRLVWTLDAGLPDPLVNERVFDLDGNYLGRPDLLDEESGAVGEFDGSDHFARDVATVDHVREEGFERNGLIVGRFTGLDLLPGHLGRTVWRLQRARERGLAQRHVPRTWRVAR